MFQKIWQVGLLSGIIFYAGNVYFAPDACAKVEKSGSVVRVFASGLFFLTDNWLSAGDQVAARAYAHSADMFVQDVVRVTFYGRDLKCAPAVAAKSSQPNAVDVKSPVANKSEVPASTPKDNTPKQAAPAPVVNTNPYNLPSLPDTPADGHQ